MTEMDVKVANDITKMYLSDAQLEAIAEMEENMRSDDD